MISQQKGRGGTSYGVGDSTPNGGPGTTAGTTAGTIGHYIVGLGQKWAHGATGATIRTTAGPGPDIGPGRARARP